MSRRVAAIILVAATAVGLATWAVVRFTAPPVTPGARVSGSGDPQAGSVARRIAATLYYVAPDGLSLTAVQREVLFGDTPAEQIRRIIEAQIEPAPEGVMSAIPPGVILRGVFVSEGGDAYVDFSPELRRAHPGGSLNEIFTVYTIVSAVTANLPAVRAVQILVEGQEVDTLAGHVDLRRPLPAAPQWLESKGPQ